MQIFYKEFYQSFLETDTQDILITGDIAEAPSLCEILSEFSQHANKPIYFVLGNHDYYYSSVEIARRNIKMLCKENKKLVWLGKPEIVKLNKNNILIGQDGWADGRYGSFDQSNINLNDSRLIAELLQAKLVNKSALKNEMQKLADTDSKALKQTITKAITLNPDKIIIATHVPPFPECSWHKDKQSDENWLPYFSSKAMGDAILAAAKKYPKINFLVLCGHTHTAKSIQIFNNLKVTAGGSEYYNPQIRHISIS